MASIDGGNAVGLGSGVGNNIGTAPVGDDPNTITDPTGGAANFNIEQVFQSFGYQPTQAEISALAPAFEGGTNVGQTGTSAVAEYVQAHQSLGAAQTAIQGNLLDEQTAAKNADTLGQVLETQGQEAYDAAAAVYSQAPKLFGSLTADQIGTFLAPAKQAFDQAQGSATGAASARGLSGSSIEGNAIGQNLTNFMQSVLSQGLGIGQTQQQNQAQALQAKGAALNASGQQQFGLGVQDRSLAQGSAGQNYDAAAGISGLAGSAVNQAIEQQAAIKALNPDTRGILNTLGKVDQGVSLVSDITSGIATIGSAGGNKIFGGATPTGSLLGNKGAAAGSGVTPTGSAVGAGGGLATSSAVDYTGGLEAGGGAASLAALA